jgi:hypothetical protein
MCVGMANIPLEQATLPGIPRGGWAYSDLAGDIAPLKPRTDLDLAASAVYLASPTYVQRGRAHHGAGDSDGIRTACTRIDASGRRRCQCSGYRRCTLHIVPEQSYIIAVVGSAAASGRNILRRVRSACHVPSLCFTFSACFWTRVH